MTAVGVAAVSGSQSPQISCTAPHASPPPMSSSHARLPSGTKYSWHSRTAFRAWMSRFSPASPVLFRLALFTPLRSWALRLCRLNTLTEPESDARPSIVELKSIAALSSAAASASRIVRESAMTRWSLLFRLCVLVGVSRLLLGLFSTKASSAETSSSCTLNSGSSSGPGSFPPTSCNFTSVRQRESLEVSCA